jgi:hypothetical protein
MGTESDLAAVADRVAVEDLYDRQLEAIERRDFPAYDDTFTRDAIVDLTGLGEAVFTYPDYRAWLIALVDSMVAAQRLRGGLRLTLQGDLAIARVPVACHVTFDSSDGPVLTHSGVFYEDELVRTIEGWKVARRRESISWSA